jgi:hypothetical protein
METIAINRIFRNVTDTIRICQLDAGKAYEGKILLMVIIFKHR